MGHRRDGLWRLLLADGLARSDGFPPPWAGARWLTLHVRRREHRHNRLVLVAVVVATVAGGAAYLGLEPLIRKFEEGDASKLVLAGEAVELAYSQPWLGVGRGAFSAAFSRIAGATERFTHPENLIVQWVTEWAYRLL